MSQRVEKTFAKMTQRLAAHLAMDAWLVRASAVVAFEIPEAVPAAADATHIAIKVFPERVREQRPAPAVAFSGLEDAPETESAERSLRVVAAGLDVAPAVDDRIIFPDGRNFKILKPRYDGHAANQRTVYVVACKKIEAGGPAGTAKSTAPCKLMGVDLATGGLVELLELPPASFDIVRPRDEFKPNHNALLDIGQVFVIEQVVSSPISTTTMRRVVAVDWGTKRYFVQRDAEPDGISRFWRLAIVGVEDL